MQATLADARRALQQRFGFPDFRPAQLPVIESVLAGVDTVAVLPTGGGKSLCYQVPAIVRGGLTLVVSPLISLMQDQVDRLHACGVSAEFLNSTLSPETATQHLAGAVSGDITLLYVAPERFETPGFLDKLRRAPLTALAVDEAHCISEWGHEFRPSFRRIGAARRALGQPPIVALTATATPAVRDDIIRQLGLSNPHVHVAGFDRANLSYAACHCASDADKTRALLSVVREHRGPTIVYAATRGTVELVARRLTRAGVPAVAYHAGLGDARRQMAQEAFMRGSTRVIVATNAFGMGIDKPDVRLVVHYAMPGTLEAYYQEAGRAGRDGLPSHCLLLYDAADRFTHERFISRGHPPRSVVERIHAEFVESETGKGAGVSAPPITADARTAALAFLQRHRVVERTAEATRRLHLRLLATPTRIRRELASPESRSDLTLLRNVWRSHGPRVYDGVELTMSELRIGTSRDTRSALDRLRDHQFLDVRELEGHLRLTRPRAPLHAQVRWSESERRHAHEISKLDAMEAYARTTVCRRAFVLRYFGDTAGGDTRARCTGCDNCLRAGSAAPWPWRRSR